MPDFKSTDVDSKKIDNTADSIEDDVNELLSICSFIQGDVMVNLDPYWQGQAKQSFEKQFGAYYINLLKLVEGYKEINDQLKKAGVAYEKADDTVRQLIAKMPR